MRIKPIVYGILVVAVFFGIILGFKSVGFWAISGKADASGNRLKPIAGDTATIKGWMSLEEVSSTFNVSVDEIVQQFNLPADTQGATTIKSLENEDFSVSDLKSWLNGKIQASGATQTP